MAEADKQDHGSKQQGTTERAEELLERAGHTAGLIGSMFGTRLARIGAFAYEEAEDVWAEAQQMRQQYVSAREVDEQEVEGGGEPPAEAKADTAPPESQEQSSEPDKSVEPDEGEPPESVEATAKARHKAEELGVDLHEVEGTGKGGKITKSDVKKEAQQTQS